MKTPHQILSEYNVQYSLSEEDNLIKAMDEYASQYKIKNKLPLCPICHSNKPVINDGSGSTWGSVIIGQPTEDDKILNEGVTENHYYCTKCLTTFDIQISYKTYKDPRPKLSGHTGCH